MIAWIGLGSAEGVQPANGTTILPTVETSCVRWQTKANMVNHPKTPYFTRKSPSLRKKKKRSWWDYWERKEEVPRSPKVDGKTKTNTTQKKKRKNRKKLQVFVRGSGWEYVSIVSYLLNWLYIQYSVLLHTLTHISLFHRPIFLLGGIFFFFFFFKGELDR